MILVILASRILVLADLVFIALIGRSVLISRLTSLVLAALVFTGLIFTILIFSALIGGFGALILIILVSWFAILTGRLFYTSLLIVTGLILTVLVFIALIGRLIILVFITRLFRISLITIVRSRGVFWLRFISIWIFWTTGASCFA